MKKMFFILALISLCFAFTVTPDYENIKDTGKENGSLDIDITIDCETTDTTLAVTDEQNGSPVYDAEAFLFYTDYGYHLVSSGKTNENGLLVMDVPGNINYLRALFILRVDKAGYNSREIEFTYEKCSYPPEEEPPENETWEEPEENETYEEPPEVPENQTEEVPEEENGTYENQTEYVPEENATETEEEPPGGLEACLPALIILGILFSIRLT